mmetsp:Transcript_85244/g.264906  ORF Transcript_85244/g.264906 Transcript_85244/m.264906 type:complete len:209 (+) Transcript_85244:573-1199(+)
MRGAGSPLQLQDRGAAARQPRVADMDFGRSAVHALPWSQHGVLVGAVLAGLRRAALRVPHDHSQLRRRPARARRRGSDGGRQRQGRRMVPTRAPAVVLDDPGDMLLLPGAHQRHTSVRGAPVQEHSAVAEGHRHWSWCVHRSVQRHRSSRVLAVSGGHRERRAQILLGAPRCLEDPSGIRDCRARGCRHGRLRHLRRLHLLCAERGAR